MEEDENRNRQNLTWAIMGGESKGLNLFQKFDWKNLDFIDKYNNYLDEFLCELDQYLRVDLGENQLGSLYKKICQVLLKAARHVRQRI